MNYGYSLFFPASLNSKIIILASCLFMIFFLAFPICAFSDNTHRYINQADHELLEKNYKNAIAKYFKGILYASWKEKIEIWDDLGFAYLKNREFEKAKHYLLQSLNIHPENFNPHFYLAVACLLSGETSSASEHLQVIEKNVCFDSQWIDEYSALILYKPNGKRIEEAELQRIRNERGIYLKKTSENERIIHLDAFDERNEGAFYFVLGIVSKLNGVLDKAEKKLIEALNSGYNDWEVSRHLADVYHRQGRDDKAEVQIKKVSNRLPAFPIPLPNEIKIQHKLYPPNHQLLMVFHKRFLKELEKGHINKAIATLVRSLEADEQSFLINHNLALLYFDTDQIEKAESHCGRALWFKDEHPLGERQIIGCHDLMGNIYFHKKKFEKALNEFKNILRIDEKNATAHYNLGSVYYALGDHKNAEQGWKKAIECEEELKRTNKRGEISDDQLDVSLIVFHRPVSFRAHKSLGRLYLERNLQDKALKEFKNALEIEPDDPEPHYEIGKIYHAKSEFDEKYIRKAIFYYEKYIYMGGEKEKEVRELLKSLK